MDMGRHLAKKRRRAGRSQSNTPAASRARLIGLTGTNGAGKGEVANYLMGKGYSYISLSDEIRAHLRRRGMESTRDQMIAAGNALRRRYGADILARRVLRKVKGPTVIDSIRNGKEIACLRRRGDFILVAVDAPARLRFERVLKRGRAESASTLEEFIAKENKEMTGGRDGQQLRRCLELADITIINDGTLEALHRRIEERL